MHFLFVLAFGFSAHAIEGGCTQMVKCAAGVASCSAVSGVQFALCTASAAKYLKCTETTNSAVYSQYICCDASGNALATTDANLAAQTCASR